MDRGVLGDALVGREVLYCCRCQFSVVDHETLKTRLQELQVGLKRGWFNVFLLSAWALTLVNLSVYIGSEILQFC